MQEKVDSGGYTDAEVISRRPAGMTSGQALKNRDSILQRLLQETNAEIDHAIDIVQKRTGQPRAMQGKLFGQPEGQPDVGTEKAENIEDVFNAANAAELNKSRMRATEKSKKIEAANRGRNQQAGASMTASERVALFKSERKRVEGELAKARAELTRLQSLAARPAGEIGYRPTSEDIRAVTDTINGYERTLQGVREQLQDAEADFDNGIETPTPRQRQEIQRVDLTAEQEQLFDTENFEDNAVEVTERKAAPIVDERGAIVPSSKKGENPIASAGFKTLDEDNNISDNLVGATFITGMDVSARNKGAGTRLLNAITNWADTNGKTLVLVPSANPDPELGGLSQKQLKAWYARNGFEDRVDYMVRVPTEERTQETEKIQETKPAEIVREGKKPPEKSVKAPATDTEHIVQTEEGGKIKGFFDSILPASSSPAEQERHGNSKNTAAETMLEFDIARPGETTSAGSQKMLDYLARRVGGQEKLNKLLAALQNASPDEQSRLLKNAGLPDLTTRRGMDEFSSQVQEYVDQMVATGEGPLYNIRTSKMRPSQVTGTKLPYQETITTAVTVTQRYDTPLGEKPRRPSQGIKEIVRDINDNKLRAAALVLKQMTGKISPQAQAAITYLTNLNRSTFGDALRDLAFDLAYFELDPKYYGAGSTFYKEGGKYAQDFRAWIETNLDASTVALLDELIAEHKQNAAEAEKFENAITAYNQLLEIAAEKNRKKAEGQGAKLPKAPRRKRTAKERLATMQEEAETEAGEGEETLEPFTEADTRNLPTVEMLTEVHPAIRRLLMDGDTHGALELLAQVKNNKYYAELAQRILDTGFTAETRLIDPDTIKSLSNDPKVTESLNERLDALRDLVETLFPQEQQASIISDLKSGKLRNLLYALETMQGTLEKNGGTESNQQLLDSVIDLVNREFVWIGKYEPASDIIVMRQGVGQLTNHLLLHESLHAAASHLLDNPNRLVGIQRQGYDRLNELFQYSKGLLEQKGITSDTVYGLQDLHEFVSEAMTNPELQALLRSIRYKAAPFSLWNRFTDSVSKLFNVKPGEPSNVMVEVMFAADAMMAGTMSLEGMQGSSTPRAMATKGPRRRTTVPPGMPNQPSTIRRWMMADTWTSGKMREIRSMNAGARKAYLGMLTLRQINDLVGGRIGQIGNFINVTEKFLARKSQILKESGDIAQKWERLQAADPEMSRKLGVVMHSATILEIDPDKATLAQRTNNAKLMNDWRALNPEAKTIYREVRNFYERRYSQYKRLMNRRIIQMRQLGVSEATITEIRNEFEKGKRAGPYFPLMRFGRFWYQVGKGQNREYYMFESEAARDMHRDERLKRDPHLGSTIGQNIGNDYQQQMDFHARESAFLKSAFAGVDSMDMTGLTPAEADKRRTELKDNLYQTYLANQPDRSMRNAFVHRNSIAGYSEDALRSFASSSFSMAYQMSRFEYSPEMFSQLDAARAQIKGRFTPGAAFDPALVRENDELRDYVGEIDRRLAGMLNPTDTGKWVSYFSNIGFIYYLTSIGSAVVNVMGGAMIGVPTLIGQQVRANPKMGYTEATARVLYNTSKTMAQIMLTGFDVQAGGRVLDSKLLSPSLDRSKSLSAVDRAAYNRFVADGLIDITAAYDQSGLASSPTSEYNSIPNKAMQVVAYAFHHAERFNREIIAMSAFRSAMEKRANYPNQQQAFAESIAEAKDLTARSMFDYSEANKPRFLQNAVAKIILQFKQFPQQMTWFLANSAWNSFGNLPEAEKREARARFVGTMGMAAIFSGVTGLWGFSTVAAIVNAVAQATAGDDDEPFDFELEFANWAVNTFGKNMGTMLSRGMGNAAGIDLHSRLSLDGMWFRDGRQNQDAVSAVESYMVGLLGPTVGGLPVTAARVYDLYNKGHGDRALEAALPGFAKQPMIAYRYSQEGAKTLQGDIMKKEFTPFELMMQSLGIRPADLAEIQFRNIKVKGQEQAIIKKRQNMLNIFALTFMANDPKGNQEAFDKIMKFNKKYPSMAIDADGMINSIAGKLEKSAQTDHGLYVDPKLQYLFKDTYIKKLTEKEPEGPWNKYKTPAMETAEE
jgi:predicted ester cyclase